MSGNLATLAAAHVGRPLLMRPQAALELGQRLRAVDAKAFVRPSRLSALLSKLARGPARPQAMDDDDSWTPPPPLEERLAYCPLYIGEPDALGFCWALKDGVALMQANTALSDRGEEYCGEVYHGYDTLLAAFREAADDDRVKAIFLREFSPGGVVAGGLDALSDWMLANREAAGGKPIWVYADMSASAAYWIAASADRIIAPRVGLIGSIGAVIVHENYEKALAEHGLEITSIEFPLGKTDGAWWKALSAQAREDWEAEIRQCGENFFAAVQAGRPALTRDLLEGLGARCFMGQHDDPTRSALAIGLVDAIASEEAAFAELRAKISTPVSAPGFTGSTPIAAAGARGVSTLPKETPMAAKAPTTPGRQAALATARTALAAAQADLARLEAEGGDAPAEEEDADPDAPAEAEAPADPDPADDAAPDEGEDESKDESQAIAASAEAKAEPELALSAIRSGQSLAQFKATVAAVSARPRAGGQLSSVLNGSPRLGADGPGANAAGGLSPKEIYSRRKGRTAAKA